MEIYREGGCDKMEIGASFLELFNSGSEVISFSAQILIETVMNAFLN